MTAFNLQVDTVGKGLSFSESANRTLCSEGLNHLGDEMMKVFRVE